MPYRQDLYTCQQPRILRTNTGYKLGALHAEGLPPRESQALLLRASGLSIADCASAMNCCKSSVQDRVSNMFYKLHVDSTPALITKAFQSGFLKFLTLAAAIHLGAAMPDHHKFSRTRLTRLQTRHENRAA